MPKVSFDIPAEVKKTIARHKEIKWDRVVSDALQSYTKKISLLEALVKKSKLTPENASSLNKIIKKRLAGKYKVKN